MLKKDLISSPGLWQLAIELHTDSVDVLATPLLPDMQPLRRQVPMNRAISSQLAAFEELVYDNPLLLAEFNAVTVLIDTRRFMFMPIELGAPETAQAAIDALWPDSGCVAVVNKIEAVGEALVMAVDEGILSFIKRTYPDAPLRHPMEVMIEAVAASDISASGARRLVVDLQPNTLRIVGIRWHEGHPVLAIANVFDAQNADDAVYYILAAAQATGLDLATDNITLTGDSPLRDELTDKLSRFTTIKSEE